MNNADMQLRYEAAKKGRLGETVSCPTCQVAFVKAKNDQAFCSSKGKGNCKDAYWTAIRSTRVAARNTAPVDPEEPTDEQRAIEHAEYLAAGADHVLEANNAFGLAAMALSEAEEGADLEDLQQELDNASGVLNEALANLRSLAYEFRKRSARAKAGGHGPA